MGAGADPLAALLDSLAALPSLSDQEDQIQVTVRMPAFFVALVFGRPSSPRDHRRRTALCSLTIDAGHPYYLSVLQSRRIIESTSSSLQTAQVLLIYDPVIACSGGS